MPMQNTVQDRELVHKVIELAEKYNADPVLALKIISCEGGLDGERPHRNYNKHKVGMDPEGVPIYEYEHWSTDFGYWQVNDFYHKSEALRMGYDIHNLEDNLEFGMILFKKEGTKPWDASKRCWDAPPIVVIVE